MGLATQETPIPLRASHVARADIPPLWLQRRCDRAKSRGLETMYFAQALLSSELLWSTWLASTKDQALDE